MRQAKLALTYRLKSGKRLLDELQYCYDNGIEYVTGMCGIWENLRGKIDPKRYEHVRKRLKEQEENARFWRDVCMEYFRQFPKLGK